MPFITTNSCWLSLTPFLIANETAPAFNEVLDSSDFSLMVTATVPARVLPLPDAAVVDVAPLDAAVVDVTPPAAAVVPEALLRVVVVALFSPLSPHPAKRATAPAANMTGHFLTKPSRGKWIATF